MTSNAVVADPAADDPLAVGVAGSRVIRGGMVRTGGYLITLVAGLLSVPLIIRHLGVVDSGRYFTVMSIVAVLAALVEAGLSTVGIREYSVRSGVDRDVMIRYLLGLRLAISLAAGLLTVALMGLVGYAPVLLAGAAVASAGVLLESAASSYNVWLAATLRLSWLTAAQVLRQLTMVALTVVLVVAGASLLPFFVAVAIAPLAQLAVTFVVSRRAVPHLPAFDPSGWWALLRLALPFATATTLGILSFRVPIILMSLIATERETGWFGAPFRMVEVIVAGVMLVVGSAFPVLARAAKADRERFESVLRQLVDFGLLAGVWLALMTVIGAEVAIDVVAGPGFEPSIAVLRIQGVALFPSLMLAAGWYGLLALSAFRGLLLANLFGFGVATVLTLALVPSMGASGGALAALCAELLLAGACALVLTRHLQGRWLTLRIVPRVIAATALAGGFVVLVGLPAVLAMGLATIVYVAVLLATDAVPSELRHAAASALGRAMAIRS